MPIIIDNGTVSPVIINEHDNVTMECQARGRPRPYITWFRRNNDQNNRTQLENQVLANSTDGQYHLINVNRYQTGHYECRASNGVNEHVVSKDIEIRVLSTVLEARFRINSKRRYSVSTKPFSPPEFSNDDDPSIDSSLTTTSPPPSDKNQANEQQIAHFIRLLYNRLNLSEAPNVTMNFNDGAGVPSSIVKQLKQLEQHSKAYNNEGNPSAQQKYREDNQATTERAILPGDIIQYHTCQRQLAVKFNLDKQSASKIDCFRFAKSPMESKSLPHNQYIKKLCIYVKKTYFDFKAEEDQRNLKRDMFHVYQVFRPTSNETSLNPAQSLTGTIRLSISEVKQLNDKWLELTIDSKNGSARLQQIYDQFLSPWYGLAISHEIEMSPWSSYYRRYNSKQNYDAYLRSNDNDQDNEKESEQQIPYMLVEYGAKIPSYSFGNRATRGVIRSRPATTCDPKSPCCRRPLIIDLDQGINGLDFIILPRKIDIGECIGLCGAGGSSLKHTEVKNAQAKNEAHAGYNLLYLYHNGLSHKNATITNTNKADQRSSNCCSYSRTGGIDLLYQTQNGAVIRKFLPIPPSIRAESTIIYSTNGKNVELRCSAIVPFDTKIYWQRLDNKTLSKSQKQQQYTTNDVIQASLYLTDIESYDFGFYGCFAESISGQNHAMIELREHHRSSTSHLIEKNEVTTARIQILKRNKSNPIC
ncbi:unnamed protein product [Adineta steineri]|uniref:Uncharacterized protein n=1 Tax=Adineta steineri TaxID=433720 RepID=A0A819AYJ9_9BILA|nr:unnamed protein product [Adineta steineri]CAF1218695.1 unnamed protein product [Adineta steineri]CAF3532122.1 unnamed protein product [Adineta steineri]CAF3792800.1 unnamed protein product [Adineta steineri]